MASAAFISDIHANLEALDAVLADIRRRGIGDVFCLGDLVGYGPDPVACVDRIMESARAAIRGNHDEAIIRAPIGFNPVARGAIEWTRDRLQPRFWRPGSRRRWEFLRSLPLQYEWNGFLLVHGSPRDPTSEYIMDRDILFGPPDMFQEIFARFETVCLVGHTHIPGVFFPDPRFRPQRDLDRPVPFEGTKMVINVGSVGQPRDHDPRASYVTFEGDAFHFHRVEYDFEATRRKIRAIPQLDPRLGDRLTEGV
jgi:diadenosine tetraphosphatase ApaH/serine/threonine PP2A family protein phosphatase